MATNAELSLSLLIKETTTATRELSKLEEQFKKTSSASRYFDDGIKSAQKSMASFVKSIQVGGKASSGFSSQIKASGKVFSAFKKNVDDSGKTFNRLGGQLTKSGKSLSVFSSDVNKAFSTLETRSSSAVANLKQLETQLKNNAKAGSSLTTKSNSPLTASAGLEESAKPKGRFRTLAGKAASGAGKVASGVGSGIGKALNGAKGLAVAAGGPASLSIAMVEAGQKVVEVATQFETLEARISTIGVSAAKSKEIFANLKDMAQETPHSIEETTNSFMALYNNGLTPTQESMTAYGDIASTLGMTLEDVANSVINATSNQAKTQQDAFANLGVTAQKNGDMLTLTYNGVTSNIKDNSESIQTYLTELGRNNFAGAMAKEMDTMGGRIDRFGSEWDELFLNIGDAGVGDVIKDSISLATSALDEFNNMLASGELAGYLGAIAEAYNLDELAELFSGTFDGIGDDVEKAIDFIAKSMLHLPANAEMLVEMLLVHLKKLPDQAGLYGAQFKEFILAQLDILLSRAGAIGRELVDQLNPFADDEFDYDAATKNITEQAAARAKASSALFEAQEKAIAKSKQASLKLIEDERNASIEAIEAQIAKAKQLREEHDKTNEARKKAYQEAKTNEDIGLKKPVINNKEVKSAEDKQNKQTEVETKKAEERQDKLVKQQEEQNQTLIEQATSFLHQLAGVGNQLNAEITDPKQIEDIAAATKEVFDSGADLFNAIFPEKEEDDKASLEEDSTQEGNTELETQNEEKLAATQAFAEEQTQIEVEQTRQKNKALAEIEREQQSQRLNQASDFFGGVASVAAAFGGKQSKAAKAAAIAQTTIKTYESATNAYASLAGIPYVGPALGIAAAAAAVAAGMANVQAIKSTNYSGAYDHGGLIPAGKIGLVGEYGPELIAGPMNVTSRRTTAGLSTSTSNADQAPQNIDKSVKFNYVINANDSDGVAQVMKRERQKIMRDVRYAMESGEWD
ncbi:hypothetical protein ACSLBF_05045 [Pseudoalteromonas sp. T1lg65]|uniref:hypothetical protein n=1 Tax=Pseudoalteromonas sp. T1lg65 TaxID=2077101 RepID=UPI003F792334